MAELRHLLKIGGEKMAGRPRKIVDISTGKIGKQKIKNRQEQEKKIKLTRKMLEVKPPEWLDEVAQEEFRRVVDEAKKINLFDNLDLAILAIYADSYSRYKKCVEQINTDGMIIFAEGGKFAPSPYVKLADMLATQIQKCSTKLGLFTTDRLKLIVPTKEEIKQNKFSACF